MTTVASPRPPTGPGGSPGAAGSSKPAGSSGRPASGGRLAAVSTRLAHLWVAPVLSRRSRVALLVALVVGVPLLALLDGKLEAAVPFDELYLVPILLGTALGSGRTGMALAAEAGMADALGHLIGLDRHQPVEAVTSGVALFVVLSLVVLLLVGRREAVDNAHRAETRSREFLNLAAHQLRTPLAGLCATAEALVGSGVPTDEEALLVNLALDARRIGRLSDSLLRLARLDAGRLESRPQLVAPAVWCDEQLVWLRRTSPHLEVGVTSSGPLPLVSLDPLVIGEALNNLLDNARRHAVSRIEVGVRVDGPLLELSVADDGPGLPLGTEEDAFGRFVTLDGRGGSGLGLTVARALVEQENGELRYLDDRFVMHLPLDPIRSTPGPPLLRSPQVPQ